ncbi:MAG: tryptophan--tRNA ligase [Patescibacteria group bacterium]
MKEMLFSGVKPTSIPTLGNYIGALKQWTKLQHEYPSIFCIVDSHAITVPQDPKELRRLTMDIAATYLAVGLDPKRTTMFIQSEVSEHAELAWILSCSTRMGELSRMTQFKDKSQKEGADGAGVGLFTYPVLMAADILLYDTTVVPVGEDQVQHVELTRDIAQRFNSTYDADAFYEQTFVLPKVLIQEHGARIMSLQDPLKKMSKSDESKIGTILLDDDAETITKKIMKAVTDADSLVKYDPETKPAISNLMVIHHHMTGKTMDEIETEFAGKGYGDFKKAVAEGVVNHLAPITKRIHELRADPSELNKILDEGAAKAREIAKAKLDQVKKKVGLGR